MTAEPSNASTERILSLMRLLMAGKYSREEILAKIDAYHRDADPDSEHRMFERDIATIEHSGVQVERSRSGVARYSVAMEQFTMVKSEKAHEEMHPTALDAGLLVWIPRALK